jgi:tyrosine-protein phosphatase SIW14
MPWSTDATFAADDDVDLSTVFARACVAARNAAGHAPPDASASVALAVNYLTFGSGTDILSALAASGGLHGPLGPPPLVVELPVVEVGGVSYALPQLFGVTERGVYRCGLPTAAALPFVKRLRLRTVINLLDQLPPEYSAFIQAEGIRYVHCAVKGNKAHCEEMNRAQVRAALAMLLDASNAPILVHCRSGKHRTGALIGCLRMVQDWDLEAACDEYVVFCQHKQREVDKQYIERFDPRTLARLAPPRERWATWLPDDAFTHASALQVAIEKGLVTPAEAAHGIRVSAIERGPDEPGYPFHSPSLDPPSLPPAATDDGLGAASATASGQESGAGAERRLSASSEGRTRRRSGGEGTSQSRTPQQPALPSRLFTPSPPPGGGVGSGPLGVKFYPPAVLFPGAWAITPPEREGEEAAVEQLREGHPLLASRATDVADGSPRTDDPHAAFARLASFRDDPLKSALLHNFALASKGQASAPRLPSSFK